MSGSTMNKAADGAAPVAAAPTAPGRILFVPEITNFGGGERVYLSLSRFLHGRGIRHRIVSYYQDIRLQDYADWPLEIELILPNRSPVKKAWALKRYIARQQALGAETPLLFNSQSGLHAGAFGVKGCGLVILDTPSLLTGQAAPQSLLKRAAARARHLFSESLMRRGVRLASPLIITTDVMADEVKSLYGVRPVVSRQGVAGDKDCFHFRPLASGKPLRLLSVSRLEDSKRIDWILRSLAALESQEPPLHARKDWELDVVGEGSREGDLRRLAADLGLADRVVFHGLVSDARLEEIYGAADLSLMPAVQGYGLPALEALTRKIPVVMHAQSGVSEILGGSPWVEIITGDEESLMAGLDTMVGRLLAGALSERTLPDFPTESQWAEEVCRLCGWIETGAGGGAHL